MPSSTRSRKSTPKAAGLRSNTPEFKVSTKKGRRAMADKAKQVATKQPGFGRDKAVPPADPHAGLSGDALAKAKEGQSLKQQVQQARSKREYNELTLTTTKEDTMSRSTKQSSLTSKRTRKDRGDDLDHTGRKHTSDRKPRKAQPTGITPAVIAKRAKVTPLEVRKHLRSQKRITRKPEGWLLTEKQAESIIKALKA
jgi:hypothetical protein